MHVKRAGLSLNRIWANGRRDRSGITPEFRYRYFATSPNRYLRPLACWLAVVIGLILILTWGSIQIQVTLSGFLNGESAWSKAQKQAVVDLTAYAETGEPLQLERFRANYQLLLSDGAARDAIADGRYDPTQVRVAMERGRIMPEATSGILLMLRCCTNAPYMREAIRAWRAADSVLRELDPIAHELQQAYATGSPDIAWISHQVTRIYAVNERIDPLTHRFPVAVAEGADRLGRALFCCVLLAASIALALWLRMATRALQRIRGTEERFSLLFDSAADAIIMTDDSGLILGANQTAQQWTGLPLLVLDGVAMSRLFVPIVHRSDGAIVGQLLGANGISRIVEMRESSARWGAQRVVQSILRDITERVTLEKQQRIASEALAGIAEGVIFSDAKRYVTRVNTAHIHMTGFTAKALEGVRFDEIRALPDGSPIPDSVWATLDQRGNWSGEVVSRRHDGSRYPELLSISIIRDAEGNVEHYVAIINDVSEAKAHERALRHLATHDSLTDLINRKEFERCCEQAISAAKGRNSMFAVLFIDLDAFKAVNDSYTHAVGDRLLVSVASRIRSEVGGRGIVGRIGGDEFTVLLPDLYSREATSRIANRLLAALAKPIQIDEHELALGASIGIACYPLDGSDVPTLITNADAAMYAAKTEERNAYRFFGPRMQADVRRRAAFAAELRNAIANDEFYLAYQPTVDMRTENIIGVEALVRWKHPLRGVVSPVDFIPMAERIGLIRRIDQWVLRTALKQLRAWDIAGLPSIRLAVNVSASWFGQPKFMDEIRILLTEFRVAPGRLMLEITEGTILRLGDDMERALHQLHNLGVRLAIDDFGTGYSSLSYLKLQSISHLKIDKSFIAGLATDKADYAIVQAALALCKQLGLQPVAEGIETREQHGVLLGSGCVEGQGYLYSRPVEPQVIEGMLLPDIQVNS